MGHVEHCLVYTAHDRTATQCIAKAKAWGTSEDKPNGARGIAGQCLPPHVMPQLQSFADHGSGCLSLFSQNMPPSPVWALFVAPLVAVMGLLGVSRRSSLSLASTSGGGLGCREGGREGGREALCDVVQHAFCHTMLLARRHIVQLAHYDAVQQHAISL